MSRTELSDIVEAFRGAQSFLVLSHPGPDGDAVGSTLALAHFLEALGKKQVVCVNDDPVPRIYQWLSGAERIVRSDTCPPVSADMAVLVDVSRRDRVGKAAQMIAESRPVVVLDHHLEERPEGDLNFVDPTRSSVGEIVVDLFEAAGLEMSPEAAQCAYVALVTDTGGFRYANTTPRCHRIAARLLEAGVDPAAVSARVFDTMSAPKFDLLRHVVHRMQREMDGRLAHTYLNVQDMEQAAAGLEDLEGLVNFARNIEGVVVGALFRELSPEETKVSLRARAPFNCAQFLERFGGGGHAGAAGATLEAPLTNATQRVLKQLRIDLGDLS